MTRRQHPAQHLREGSGTSVLWQPSVPQTSHDSYGMSDNAAAAVSPAHLCGDGGFLPPPSLISPSLAAVTESIKESSMLYNAAAVVSLVTHLWRHQTSSPSFPNLSLVAIIGSTK